MTMNSYLMEQLEQAGGSDTHDVSATGQCLVYLPELSDVWWLFGIIAC